MKEIPLTQGKITIVDDEDYKELSKHKWRYSDGYASRRIRLGYKIHRGITMSRIIMNAPEGMTVDHINGDTLDNRRNNLRLCTQAQNTRNSKGRYFSSKYKGVGWIPRDKKWRATIGFNYKVIHLGQYIDETDAARAYDEAAKKYHGEFARLNFSEVFIALPGVDEREIVTDKREENPTQGIVDDLRRES